MDIKIIRDLMLRFDKSSITKLKIKSDDTTIELEKEKDASYSVQPLTETFPLESGRPISKNMIRSIPDTIDDIVEEDIGESIDSPMVGTFYESPAPGADIFIKEGDIVKIGDPLCVIEAMKIMNTIEAEFDCKILKILVKDGQVVEYNMPIFTVEKL